MESTVERHLRPSPGQMRTIPNGIDLAVVSSLIAGLDSLGLHYPKVSDSMKAELLKSRPVLAAEIANTNNKKNGNGKNGNGKNKNSSKS